MADNAGKQDPPRLDEFSSRLDAAQKRAAPDDETSQRGRAIGTGFRLGSELLAAMIVGPLLGLVVDRFAGISPWGLIGGILLGFVAGVRNVATAMKARPAGESGDKIGQE